MTIPALVLTTTAMVFTGCSTRLARENVFANTETLLGISLAQNPATQLYEVRGGYARHELFYVPTSKFVQYTRDDGGELVENSDFCASNDPSQTPEVLTEIEVGGRSDLDGARRFDLRQKLAVGEKAVMSNAAVVLMAENEQEVAAARPQVGLGLPIPHVRIAYVTIGTAFEGLEEIDDDPVAQLHVARLEKLARILLTKERMTAEFYALQEAEDDAPATLERTGPPPFNQPDFMAMLAFIGKWQRSIQALSDAIQVIRNEQTLMFEGETIEPAMVLRLVNLAEQMEDTWKRFDEEVRGHPHIIEATKYFGSLMGFDNEE